MYFLLPLLALTVYVSDARRAYNNHALSIDHTSNHYYHESQPDETSPISHVDEMNSNELHIAANESLRLLKAKFNV